MTQKTLVLFFWMLIGATVARQSDCEKLLNAHESYGRFSGSALVANEKGFFLSQGYGFADVKLGLTNESGTSFDVGSLTKQFTAAAIVQLASQKKLSFTDPINQHLKDWGSPKWAGITIHHLLTHTSGIPSLMRANQGLNDVRPTTVAIALQDLIGTFEQLPLRNKPGKNFSYSNSGYVLLAAIIEKVSGMEYHQYMNNEIFQRFELAHSSVGPNVHAAKPYAGYAAERKNPLEILHHSWFTGAGGIYSSTDDLHKWVNLLVSNQTGWGTLTDLLFTSHVEISGSKAYGYGWMINKKLKTVEHDGATLGFVSRVTINRTTGVKTILLTNATTDAWETLDWSSNYLTSLESQLIKLASGETIVLPVQAKAETTQLTSGSYIHNQTIQVSLDGNEIKSGMKAGVLGWMYTQSVPVKTEQDKAAQKIAELLQKKKIGKVAKHATSDMKVAIRLGLMRMGFNAMTKSVGKLNQAVVYQSAEGKAYCRFTGEKGEIDFVFYFDADNRLSGVFETAEPAQPIASVRLVPLQDGSFLIDGFDYLAADAIIQATSNGLVWKQLGREVEFKRY